MSSSGPEVRRPSGPAVTVGARITRGAAGTGVALGLLGVGLAAADGGLGRLVQTPEFVRDYIIYHELMHLREMNHSPRFWAQVAEVCPDWESAERWLKRNGSLLGL